GDEAELGAALGQALARLEAARVEVEGEGLGVGDRVLAVVAEAADEVGALAAVDRGDRLARGGVGGDALPAERGQVDAQALVDEVAGLEVVLAEAVVAAEEVEEVAVDHGRLAVLGLAGVGQVR